MPQRRTTRARPQTTEQLDGDDRAAFEASDALIWGMVQCHGPSPELLAGALAGLDDQPPPLEQGPAFELYFELRVLMESVADPVFVRALVLESLRRAISAT